MELAVLVSVVGIVAITTVVIFVLVEVPVCFRCCQATIVVSASGDFLAYISRIPMCFFVGTKSVLEVLGPVLGIM